MLLGFRIRAPYSPHPCRHGASTVHSTASHTGKLYDACSLDREASGKRCLESGSFGQGRTWRKLLASFAGPLNGGHTQHSDMVARFVSCSLEVCDRDGKVLVLNEQRRDKLTVVSAVAPAARHFLEENWERDCYDIRFYGAKHLQIKAPRRDHPVLWGVFSYRKPV